MFLTRRMSVPIISGAYIKAAGVHQTASGIAGYQAVSETAQIDTKIPALEKAVSSMIRLARVPPNSYPRKKQAMDGVMPFVDRLPPRELTGVMVAARRLRLEDRDLWEKLCLRAMAVSGQFNARCIANSLNALAHTGHQTATKTSGFKALIRHVRGHITQFSALELSLVLNAMSKFNEDDKELVQLLCDHIVPVAHELEFQGVTTVLSALGKLNVLHKPLVDILCAEALRVKDKTTPVNLSAILHGLAKLDVFDQKLFEGYCDEAVKKAGAFDSQNISNMFNALAKFEYFHKPAIECLCAETMFRASSFKPQELSVTLNAFGRLGIFDDPLIDRLSAEALEKTKDFSAQSISNILNAFAKLGKFNKQLVDELCVVGAEFNFEPQAISNILSFLAKFNIRTKTDLMKTLRKNTLLKASQFCPQEIAVSLNALKKLGANDEVMNAKLLDAAEAQASKFAPSDIWLTLNVMQAVRGAYRPALVTALVAQATRTAANFDVLGVKMTTYALESFDMTASAKALLSVFGKELPISSFTSSDLLVLRDLVMKYDLPEVAPLGERILEEAKKRGLELTFAPPELTPPSPDTSSASQAHSTDNVSSGHAS